MCFNQKIDLIQPSDSCPSNKWFMFQPEDLRILKWLCNQKICASYWSPTSESFQQRLAITQSRSDTKFSGGRNIRRKGCGQVYPKNANRRTSVAILICSNKTKVPERNHRWHWNSAKFRTNTSTNLRHLLDPTPLSLVTAMKHHHLSKWRRSDL